jgi:hypothetical protein
MSSACFLDVNVLMYAAGQEHHYKQPCLRVLAAVESGLLPIVVDAEIVQEILYRYSSIGLADRGIQLATELLAFRPTILPLGEAETRLAIDLFARHRQHGVSPRDALHAAAMVGHGITRIITVDRDFDRIPEITRIDPCDI